MLKMVILNVHLEKLTLEPLVPMHALMVMKLKVVAIEHVQLMEVGVVQTLIVQEVSMTIILCASLSTPICTRKCFIVSNSPIYTVHS